uniref:Uncharacterized protein n=1 Tax=Strigamia maritima TaxID=126957 RepID=T1IZC5_STRMM
MLTLNVDRARIISCMALYILSLQFLHSNSRFSTHWKLNGEQKIVKILDDEPETKSDSTDYVFQILNSAIHYNDYWVVENTNTTKSNKNDFMSQHTVRGSYFLSMIVKNKPTNKPKTGYYGYQAKTHSEKNVYSLVDNTILLLFNSKNMNHGNDDTIIFDLTKPLSCGPDVNFTTYDHLTAMTIRHKVKIIDEHELSFKIRDSNKVELIELETQLKFDLQTRPNEAPVYNAAG